MLPGRATGRQVLGAVRTAPSYRQQCDIDRGIVRASTDLERARDGAIGADLLSQIPDNVPACARNSAPSGDNYIVRSRYDVALSEGQRAGSGARQADRRVNTAQRDGAARLIDGQIAEVSARRAADRLGPGTVERYGGGSCRQSSSSINRPISGDPDRRPKIAIKVRGYTVVDHDIEELIRPGRVESIAATSPGEFDSPTRCCEGAGVLEIVILLERSTRLVVSPVRGAVGGGEIVNVN